jgi:hypothetical protein
MALGRSPLEFFLLPFTITSFEKGQDVEEERNCWRMRNFLLKKQRRKKTMIDYDSNQLRRLGVQEERNL